MFLPWTRNIAGLVAGPSREYPWILARQPELPPQVLNELLARARRAGFATDALVYSGTGLGTTGSIDAIIGIPPADLNV